MSSLVNQRAPSAAVLANSAPAGPADTSGSILGKRTIRDLVSQLDPSERLEEGVEEVLVEIADNFIESVTTFACQLAKHRKSQVLEAKDVLLHLERNWHMKIPGFGNDEYRQYRRPKVDDAHRERLAVVKKSAAASSSLPPEASPSTLPLPLLLGGETMENNGLFPFSVHTQTHHKVAGLGSGIGGAMGGLMGMGGGSAGGRGAGGGGGGGSVSAGSPGPGPLGAYW